MFKQYSTIGIWGLGIVGKSVITFLRTHAPHATVSVMDSRACTSLELEFLHNHNCTFYSYEAHQDFLKKNDCIIPSPGIDIKDYQQYHHKFVHEVDIFFHFWHKKVIAITGTLGKTTITELTSRVLQKNGLRVATGGNIGIALLDLLPLQEQSDCAVIELSSFQLEYATACRPDIAVITNLYPNHLDRHGTVDEYLQAKLTILKNQSEHQHALIPSTLVQKMHSIFPKKTFLIHAEHEVLGEQVYYMQEQHIAVKKNNQEIILSPKIPTISFSINWVIIAAICDLLGCSIEPLLNETIVIPEHRLNLLTTVDGCSFFDDSKSTIMQATVAATQKLDQYDIILLLGGTSKGVDRSPYIKELTHVKEIICFGKEAPDLFKIAHKHAITASHYATLEDAFQAAVTAQKNYSRPAVLLSPGGASFDLFANYKNRGSRFHELVHGFAQCHKSDCNS